MYVYAFFKKKSFNSDVYYKLSLLHGCSLENNIFKNTYEKPPPDLRK
jgi:hypothetical protein